MNISAAPAHTEVACKYEIGPASVDAAVHRCDGDRAAVFEHIDHFAETHALGLTLGGNF